MGKRYGSGVAKVLPPGFSLVRAEELNACYRARFPELSDIGTGRCVVCKTDVPVHKTKTDEPRFEHVPVGLILRNAYHALGTAETHDSEGQVPRALRSNHAVSTVKALEVIYD